MKKKLRNSSKKLTKSVPFRAFIKNRTKIVHLLSIIVVTVLSIDFLQDLLFKNLANPQKLQSSSSNRLVISDEKIPYIPDLSIDVYNNSKYYFGTQTYIQKNMGWFWNYKVAENAPINKLEKKYLRLINYNKNYFVEEEMKSELRKMNPNYQEKDVPQVFDLMTSLLVF